MKNDFERRLNFTLITTNIFYDIIAIEVIYFTIS